jgi:hypothetical protein
MGRMQKRMKEALHKKERKIREGQTSSNSATTKDRIRHDPEGDPVTTLPQALSP